PFRHAGRPGEMKPLSGAPRSNAASPRDPHTLTLRHVLVVRVPVAATGGEEIEEGPDGAVRIDATPVTLIETRLVLRELVGDGVTMVDSARIIAGKDAQTGVLRSVRVLRAEVPVEGVVVAGEEADAIPASPPGP